MNDEVSNYVLATMLLLVSISIIYTLTFDELSNAQTLKLIFGICASIILGCGIYLGGINLIPRIEKLVYRSKAK